MGQILSNPGYSQGYRGQTYRGQYGTYPGTGRPYQRPGNLPPGMLPYGQPGGPPPIQTVGKGNVMHGLDNQIPNRSILGD